MTPVEDPSKLAGKLSGSGPVLAVNNTGQISLLSLVYKLKGATIQVAEKLLMQTENISQPGRC